jgi:hypothetical protein
MSVAVGKDAGAPTDPAGDGAVRPAARWPSLPLAFVHIAALWAIAFVQPLFDLLGNNPEFFIARDNTPSDILIFAFGFMFVPPLVMTAVVALVRLISAAAGRVALCVFVSLLVAGFLLQLLKRSGLPDQSELQMPLALALGGLLGWLYARHAGWRSGVTVLGPAPLVFLVLFLVLSPVGDLIRPQTENVSLAGTSTSRTPVVVVIFDELPTTTLMDADMNIDARRWPNFARLAKESTWYRNATTVGDGTQIAVPSMLSGLRPKEERTKSNEYPRSLFSMLGRRYTQYVEEPITYVCPSDLCRTGPAKSQSERLSSLATDLRVVLGRVVLPADLANTLPAIDRDWEGFAVDGGGADGLTNVPEKAPGGQTLEGHPIAGTDIYAERVRNGRAIVQTIGPSQSRPGLWMVHYAIPHVPWRFLPGGEQYAVEGPNMPGLETDQTWGSNRFLVDQGTQRHLLQTGFADTLLGEVIDRMKDTGVWDRSLLVVAADHGLSLRPNVLRRPVTTENFAEIANVPLFIKLPGQSAGSVDDLPRETIDVVPTIAKHLDAGRGWHFDGIPVDAPRPAGFRPEVRNGREKKLVSIDFQAFLDQRAAVLKGQLERFPADPEAVWRVGPAQELVGRAVTSLPQARAANRRRVALRAQYRNVDTQKTGIVPVYVTGFVNDVPAGQPLAIAINGTIRATAESYPVGDRVRYSALVRPSDLRTGANDVRVYAVDDGQLREVANSD